MNHVKPSRSWTYLEAYPPLKVRLLAMRREGSSNSPPEWPSDAELAIESSLTLLRVREISAMGSWSNVTISEMQRFCAACRFDPTVAAHRKRVADYEYQCLKRKSRPFQWLTKSPRYQTECLPLLRQLMRLEQASPAQHVA